MGNFTCENCKGVCCITPPMLVSEEEIIRAKSLGAKLLAAEYQDGFVVSVAKEDGFCPFLRDDKCSIYDERFSVCKSFECKALDEELSILNLSNGSLRLITSLTSSRSDKKIEPKALSKKIIFKHNVKVANKDEYTSGVLATDTSTIFGLISKVIEKNKEGFKNE